jgi:hypothetical protein
LCNNVIEFGIPMKMVRLIKMCLEEHYSRVWVGKDLSDMFPTGNGSKQRDAFITFAFQLSFSVCYYVIR